jgi:DNA polymerase-3 subunit alpha
MADPRFVHLRLHSEYSVSDSIIRLEDALEVARQDRMPALALTDLSNVFGLVKFYLAARKTGIKPIAGCDVWLEKGHRMLLLCQSRQGYLRLCEILSLAYRKNQTRGRAEVRPEWFENSEGLIALSGAHHGEIGHALLNGGDALDVARKWSALFPGRFYIELQRLDAQSELCVQHSIRLASELGLPVVATHPVQFMRREDYKAHEARVCIAEGSILGDQRRVRHFSEEQYFKTQDEMAALFSDVPEAIENSVEIAKRCNLTLEIGNNKLPAFPTPLGQSLDEYLTERAVTGLDERMQQLFPESNERESQYPKYRERLDFEVAMIIRMGFPGYFLIVADFINWAKQNGVPVGPGRGSGAGSLVAYCIGITDLDPLRYDLLFERFLNPERVSMPDFDIDFCQDGRERVIDYVRQKYGEESVSQIATFGTMAAKAVVRDVGRVLDLPYGFVDSLAKLIPFEIGMTLKKAREQEPEINQRAENEEEVMELLELATALEGLTRNVGMHAGGVLIAPGKLTDFCPVYCAEGSDASVSQFDKDDVEKVGLVKFDFLGLRTLTIIDWAVRYLRMLNEQARDFSIETIPLDDAPTYTLLKSCDTTAVFQLESRGMKDLVRRLQPDCFEDIIALVALFRPGPLQSGMVDDFINRKHGRAKVDYFHPDLETVLKPTYGVIVYQEQVMQIAQILGGYSLGAADLLRRAMGKKKPEEMAKHRTIFVEGATKRGVPEWQAQQLFDLMEKFAEYGFNKSHSAAYALVAYQTAYLKAHYSSAFMASTLSADMDDTDKVKNFYVDCLAGGLELLPPDINLSDYRFFPVDAKRIRYGLGAVKGTGEAAIQVILDARKDGPFRDLFDFCKRVDKRTVNRRVIESLVRAGAFDSLNANRRSLLASVGTAMESAEQSSRMANQHTLFGETEADCACVDIPDFPMKDRLKEEKASLGFYFSGHPFDADVEEVSRFCKTRLKDLNVAKGPAKPVLLAGIVTGARIQQTRRGRMAIVMIDDGSAQVEVSIFSEAFEAKRELIKEDQMLIVEGKASYDDFSGGTRVVAENLYDIAGARSKFARALEFHCDSESNMERLMDLIAPFKGEGCTARMVYSNGKASCEVELWPVRPEDTLIESLRNHFKEVRLVYP